MHNTTPLLFLSSWIFWLAILVNVIPHQCYSIEYSGDVSIWKYLDEWCSTRQARGSKFLLAVASNHTESFLVKYLVDHHPGCDFILFLNKSPSSLLSKINHQYKFKQIQLILDYTLDQMTYAQFRLILSSQESVYFDCDHCYPFISLFNLPIRDLNFWSHQHFHSTRKQFQSIIVSMIQANGQPSTVFIRPTLDGCRLLDLVMLPESKTDFNRLKTPANRCNLNASQLNIAVNNVSVSISAQLTITLSISQSLYPTANSPKSMAPFG